MPKSYYHIFTALLLLSFTGELVAQFEAETIFEGGPYTLGGTHALAPINLDDDDDLEITSTGGIYDFVDGKLKFKFYPSLASPISTSFGDLDDNGEIDGFYSISNPRWKEDIFSTAPSITLFNIDEPSTSYGPNVYDYDNDGLDDVLILDGSTIYIQKNLGGLQFEEILIHDLDPGPEYIRNLLIEDFDSDGDLDIVMERRTNSYDNGYLIILRNISNGSIQFESETIVLNYEHIIENSLTYQLVSGDFNGDGYQDLFNRRILLLNDTQGSFIPTAFLELEDEPNASVYFYTRWKATDFNNNGKDELIRVGGENEDAYIKIYEFEDDEFFLLANLQTIFDPVTPENNEFRIHAFNIMDFNNDGILDIISDQYGSFVLYPGLGNFEFGEPEIILHYVTPDTYHLADMDSDQDLDIVLMDSHGVFICNNDLGSFSSPQPLFKIREAYENQAGFIRSIALVDVNQDNQIDVIVGDQSDNSADYSISVFLNESGSFPNQSIIYSEGLLSSDHFRKLYAGNYDSDGDPGIFYVVSGEGLYCIPYENGWLEPNFIHEGDDYFGVLEPTRVSSDKLIFFNPDGGLAEYTWVDNVGVVDYAAIGPEFVGPQDIEFLDFFNDGYPEIIFNKVDSEEGFQMDYLNQNMDGYSSLSTTFIGNGLENTGGGFELEDINDDGFPDLVALEQHEDNHLSLSTRINNGSNQFEEVGEIHYSFPGGLGAWWLIKGPLNLEDLDGDEEIEGIGMTLAPVIVLFENVLGEGCTDPLACNFDPAATEDNGSCCYGICGCTDSSAYNFDTEASCSLNNCIYSYTGVVYHDQNENWEQDEGEPGINGITIIDQLSNNTSITNQNGEFIFIMNESANLQVIHNDAYPGSTTPAVVSISPNENGISVGFGLTTEVELPEIEIEIIPEETSYPCDEWVEHILHIHNPGNLPLNGSIEFTFDELFQNFQELSPISESGVQSVVFDFELVNPGQSQSFLIDLRTPDATSIGEFLNCTASVNTFVNEDIPAASSMHEINIEMTCAYDPNDKQAFPVGYEEPNFILPETEIEYLVRFQNTGNAPATTVLIQDTISPLLDLDSFELRSSSHSVSAFTDQEDNVVNFLFEDINLPDSTSNEPESHGFITFTFNTADNLEPGNEILNTAYIYFDNNPAIITNQYHHTIFDCSSELASFEATTGLCANEELTLINSSQYIEEYYWTLNGDTISTTNDFNYTLEEGEYELQLSVSNPICEQSSSQNLTIYNYPEALITYQDFVLTANNGDFTYQWYLNDSPIEAANSSTYVPQTNGSYQVVITNQGNCSTASNELNITVTSTEEQITQSIQIFPNPATNEFIVERNSSNGISIEIKDISGKTVKQISSVESRNVIQVNDLAQGLYIVELFDDNQNFHRVKLIVK